MEPLTLYDTKSAVRLRKEMSKQAASSDEFIQLTCRNEDNLREWIAAIRGPPGSYYDGYIFDVEITVPEQYPFVPPSMKFLNKIYHPNILFTSGEVCIDILSKDWTPAWDLESACRAILSILGEPNADSPLNCDAGNMLRAGDFVAFRSISKMYCDEFATKITPSLIENVNG